MTSSPKLPVVTLLLITANLIAAFLLVFQPDLAFEFGYLPPGSTSSFGQSQPWLVSAFTSLFMHQNLMHLLGNMIFLAAVGASLELATGPIRFVLVYFVSGIAGEIAHSLAIHGVSSPQPLIGASGCIAGCVGYYAFRYPTLRVPLGPRLSAPVWGVAMGWVFLQMLGAIVRFGDAGTSISYWAHLGGLLGGCLLHFIFRAPDVGQARLDRTAFADLAGRGPSAEVMAAQRHLKRHPRDVQIWRQLAEALRTLGDQEELAETLCRIYDLTNDQSPAGASARLEIVRELASLGMLKRVPQQRRFELAKLMVVTDPSLAGQLLESLDEDPEAQFMLGELFLLSEPDRSAKVFIGLAERWPDHAATRRARARSWIPPLTIEADKMDAPTTQS